jgi:Domain of unknown function (DUF4082)/Divergent InlB B-repeat domain/Fibronectin type III domain
MNKNPPFSATLASDTRFRNLHALSLRRFLAAIASLLFVSLSLCHAAQSVTLAWNASSDSSVNGYILRYGTTSGSPSQFVDVGNATSRTLSNLNDATTYYCTVVAYIVYNGTRVESQPSNQVQYTTPGPASSGFVLTVNRGSGGGKYAPGTPVPVSADAPNAGEQFDAWTGDTAILPLQDVNKASATALMPPMNVAITATYKAATSGTDRIRYYPRAGWSDRMVGGIFEGTSGPVTGNYTPIHTITTSPQVKWIEVGANLGNYQYLRYRGPNGSNGNVSEIEFYRGGAKVTGTGYGTPGSWNNEGNTFDKALDGNVSTFFDASTSDGAYVGINTGGGGPSAVTSIWSSTAAPQVADSGPDSSVELGVKFSSDVAGTITGIRFYKAAANTGRHVGNFWTSTGELLATATFTGETPSGWQQVNFAMPVPIAANTVYVASYHVDSGHYSTDTNYFSPTAGVDNPPLHALPSNSSNRNGVYAYGANSVFPNQSWYSCNYWVDVVFEE